MTNVYRAHVRTEFSWLRPYVPGESLPDGCVVNDFDRRNGSPKEGDWIGVNKNNSEDTWLMSAAYYQGNYKPSKPPQFFEVVTSSAEV